MKTTNKILALAIMAVAMVFASCSKDDNDPVGPTQQEIEAKIIGKWKTVEENGKKVLTDERGIRTFFSDGSAIQSISGRNKDGEGRIWASQERIVYTITSNHLYIKLADSRPRVEFFYDVAAIDGISLYLNSVKRTIDEKEVSTHSLFTYNKVIADYSKDILGMWEGVAMTGDETYGDAHHRIEYRADGTYTYYNWDEATQAWKPLEDVFDEWNVDGDWLATRWQNQGSDVMNYEWWDIDYIKDGMMKWSALREKEDGTRFKTTFTWKKVK